MILKQRFIFVLVATLCTILRVADGNQCLTMLEEVTAKRVVEDEGRSINITFELSKGITQRLTSRIMKIFLVEVLGYTGVELIENTVNLNNNDNNIEDFERFSTNLFPTDERFLTPTYMINMEMWMPSQLNEKLYFENHHVKECGPIGPPGYFGWFVPKSLWRLNMTETWHIFMNEDTSSKFHFDDEILTLIKSSTVIQNSNNSNNNNNKRKHYCSDNYCNEGIYTPKQCKNLESNNKCAMLLSTYTELTSFVKKDIEELNLFVEVAWVGDNLNQLTKLIIDRYNSTADHDVNNKRNNEEKSLVILHRTPSEIIPNDEDFISITFPKCRPKSFTDICKYEDHKLVKLVWEGIERVADLAYETIDKSILTADMYTDLIHRWNNNNNDVNNDDDKIEYDIACDWLKDNLNYTLRYWKPSYRPKKNLYIGGIFPMNGESYSSKTILTASKMAEESINKNNTLLTNYHLDILAADGQCKSDMVLQSFIDYILHHYYTLIGILGPACSETIEPLIGISKQYHTTIVSYSAEGSTFDDRTKYPYFYRTIGENSYYENVYFSIFNKMKWKKITALTEDGQKYTEYISTMESKLKEHNIYSLDNVKYPRQRENDDMYNRLENLKKKRSRIIIADMYDDKVAREVMCAAYKLKMTAYEGYVWFLPLWLSEDWWDVDRLKRSNNGENITCSTSEMLKSINGYFGISHANYAADDAIMQENITVREWRDKYENLCHRQNQTPSEYASYAYDAAWTYAYAIDELIKENESYVNSLRSKETADRLSEIISKTDFQGVSGRIKFVNGASRISSVEIIQHVDKKRIKIGDFHPNVSQAIPNNNANADAAGNLMINMSAIVWFNNDKKIPDDGTEDEIKCVLNGLAKLINVSCEVAIIIVNIFGFGCLGILLIVGFVIVKRKYDKKVRQHEKYMKSLGIDLLQTDTSGLDKWEIPRECVVINRKLGEGAFGTVYGGEAFFTDKGWLAVAVKTLKVGSSTEEKLDFLSEVEVMKRFDHKNVIKLLGVCIKCEPVYTVMEFMLYGDLKTYLLARRHLVNDRNYDDYDEISSKKLTAMALDVARALSYLAQLKYVHRDVASRNCLINAQRVVKLGDFGMTRPMYENDYYKFNRKGMLPVRWMAPESLGLGIFTPASDVWSYGVLLYEIITFGSFPFQGLSNNEVLEHVKSGNTINIPSGIKGPLENLIRSCWTIDHKSRPNAPEIVDFLATNPKLLSPCLDVPLASVQLEHTGQIEMQLPEKFRKFSVSLNNSKNLSKQKLLSSLGKNKLVEIGNVDDDDDDDDDDDRINNLNNKDDPNLKLNIKYNNSTVSSSSSSSSPNKTINVGDCSPSSSSRLPLLHHSDELNDLNDFKNRSKYVQLQRSINNSGNAGNNEFLARYVNIQPGNQHFNDTSCGSSRVNTDNNNDDGNEIIADDDDDELNRISFFDDI